MKQSAQRGILVAVIVVVVVGFVVWQVARRVRTRMYTLDNVTVIARDVERRTALVEFVHPRSGLPREVRGTIPEDCPIYVNDRRTPHGLADLRVGDQGSVRALIHADQSIEAQEVRVKRADGSSQPAAGSQATTASQPAATSRPGERP